jgi:hypothetical protein
MSLYFSAAFSSAFDFDGVSDDDRGRKRGRAEHVSFSPSHRNLSMILTTLTASAIDLVLESIGRRNERTGCPGAWGGSRWRFFSALPSILPCLAFLGGALCLWVALLMASLLCVAYVCFCLSRLPVREEDGYRGGWKGRDTGNGYGNGGLEPRINPQHGERLLCMHRSSATMTAAAVVGSILYCEFCTGAFALT